MIKRLPALSIALFTLAAVTGCGGQKAADPSDYEARIHTFMLEELDVAVDGIWEHGGWVLTDEGEQSLFPETDEGWADVVASAEKVKQLSLEMTAEEYSLGQEDWIEISKGLAQAADVAKDAAIARDKQALFDAGGLIYNVCTTCHERYALDEETDS